MTKTAISHTFWAGLLALLVFLAAEPARAYTSAHIDFRTECDPAGLPGETAQFSTVRDRPGDFIKVFVPPGTVSASLYLFVPRDAETAAAVAFRCPPACVVNLAKSAESYRELPWDRIPVLATYTGRDGHVKNEGGTITVLQGGMEPLSTGGWLYIRALEFSGQSIYRLQYTFQVALSPYRAWYRPALWAGGDPVYPDDCQAKVDCDPVWAEPSETAVRTLPDPESACNVFVEAVCRMKGLDCKDDVCLNLDTGLPGPEMNVILAARPGSQLESTTVGFGARENVLLKTVTLEGIPAGASEIVAGFAWEGNLYAARKGADGSIIFGPYHIGEAVPLLEGYEVRNSRLELNAFSVLGAMPVEALAHVDFFCGTRADEEWLWAWFELKKSG